MCYIYFKCFLTDPYIELEEIFKNENYRVIYFFYIIEKIRVKALINIFRNPKVFNKQLLTILKVSI